MLKWASWFSMCLSEADAAVNKEYSTITLFACLLLTGLPTSFAQDEVGGGVLSGGVGRYVPGRWGLVRGSVSNRKDEPATVTFVVTPPGGNGMQHARRVTVPAMSLRKVQWPMLMPKSDEGLVDIPYMLVQDEGGDTLVRKESQDRVRTLAAGISLTEYGHTGIISDAGADPEQDRLDEMLRSMLRSVSRKEILVSVRPEDLDGSPQALDGLDHLCVASKSLARYPEACDAIRVWVQRGGRLLISLDQAGMEVTRLLLGDALPLTLIDKTSSNSVRLDVNPEYSKMRFPVREVQREFPEPISFYRVVAEKGEVVWSCDGWPAALTTEYGRGRVLLTTILTDAFINPNDDGTVEMIPSSSRFVDVMMVKPASSLLVRDQVVATANQQVGYAIPSRGFALAVAVGFPIAMLAVGLLLLKRGMGEKLLWLVPILALLASIPPLWKGWASRTIAPQTAIRQRVIRAIEGETQVAMDGFATVYQPNSESLQVASADNGIFSPEADPDDRSNRRLLWTSNTSNEWVQLEPPIGVRTGDTREVISLSEPMTAKVRFAENGLVGTLQSGQLSAPGDAILAGTAPDRQAVTIEGSEFKTGPEDVLTSEEFFRDTLLTQTQLQRAQVYGSLFSDLGSPVPSQLSMLYWARADSSSIEIGDDETRDDGSVLVVQPVTLLPPIPGEQITLPPVVLPYRAALSDRNDYSTIYNNGQRKWIATEKAAEITLAFDVPGVCLPFDVSSADLKVRITAGSRMFEVAGGPRSDMQVLQTFDSPAQTISVQLPNKAIERGERVFVRFKVSEPNIEREEGVTAVEQDEDWKIDRVLLTLKGARRE